MPEAHDLPGRWYWHVQRYPDLAAWDIPARLPRFTESASTREIEEPFRVGRGRVFRAWPTRWALVAGRWSAPEHQESTALRMAAGGRMMHVKLADIRQWPGTAAQDDEGVFADTDGVVSWVEPGSERALR